MKEICIILLLLLQIVYNSVAGGDRLEFDSLSTEYNIAWCSSSSGTSTADNSGSGDAQQRELIASERRWYASVLAQLCMQCVSIV